MAFENNIVQDGLIRARYACEACGKLWHDLLTDKIKTPLHLHSSNSLHLVLDFKLMMYKATSVPYALSVLQGRYFRPEKFRVYLEFDRRSDDGFCLCHKCHREIHRIAGIWTRGLLGKTLEYKNDIPNVLEYVTVEFVKNRGEWTPF